MPIVQYLYQATKMRSDSQKVHNHCAMMATDLNRQCIVKSDLIQQTNTYVQDHVQHQNIFVGLICVKPETSRSSVTLQLFDPNHVGI